MQGINWAKVASIDRITGECSGASSWRWSRRWGQTDAACIKRLLNGGVGARAAGGLQPSDSGALPGHEVA